MKISRLTVDTGGSRRKLLATCDKFRMCSRHYKPPVSIHLFSFNFAHHSANYQEQRVHRYPVTNRVVASPRGIDEIQRSLSYDEQFDEKEIA